MRKWSFLSGPVVSCIPRADVGGTTSVGLFSYPGSPGTCRVYPWGGVGTNGGPTWVT